jgi:hypothetical protein
MTLSITTLSITTLSITTLSITTLHKDIQHSIKIKRDTQHNDIQHYGRIKIQSAKCVNDFTMMGLSWIQFFVLSSML